MKEKELYTNILIKETGDSEIEITGEIPEKTVTEYRPSILKKLGKNVNLSGFRKGHVPEKVLVGHLSEQSILYEVAEAILQEAYPKIVGEHKLNIIGRPEIKITKIAPGNPIGFSIAAALMPEVVLPEYTKIAQEIMKEKDLLLVTEKEVDAVIEQILKNNAVQAGVSPSENAKEEKRPELTDENVKTLGEFKNVSDFREKLTENLKQEKRRKAREKKRVLMGEKIIEQSTISLPRVLVESELEKMLSQFRSDIERGGMKFDAYLVQIKKTKEDILKGWDKDARMRAKLQLILNKIANKENIYPNKEAVERETKHIMGHVSGANVERVKIYVETMLTNEAVFLFLESNGESSPSLKKGEK